MHTSRHKYIKLYKKNIPNFYNDPNFKSLGDMRVGSFNTKFDFYSIMLYPAFNEDGKRVIKPLEKYMYYDQFIGQRKALSDGDIERVNNMYQCSAIGEDDEELTTRANPHNYGSNRGYGPNNNSYGMKPTPPMYRASKYPSDEQIEHWRRVMQGGTENSQREEIQRNIARRIKELNRELDNDEDDEIDDDDSENDNDGIEDDNENDDDDDNDDESD
jgi:hypothetical protein